MQASQNVSVFENLSTHQRYDCCLAVEKRLDELSGEVLYGYQVDKQSGYQDGRMAPRNVHLAMVVSQLAFALALSAQQANVRTMVGTVTSTSARALPQAPLTVPNLATGGRTSVATSKVDSRPLLAKSHKLIAQLDQLADKMQSTGDLRYEVVHAHSCLSKGIVAKAAAGGFHDNLWVLKLNIRMIEKLFVAYNAYEAGLQARADWQEAFNEAKNLRNTYAQKGLTREQAAASVTILMGSAHIFGDLRASLAELGCGPKNDFLSIMDIIDKCERGLPGAVAMLGSTVIRDWRMAVWSQVCESDSGPLATPKRGSQ